MCPERNADPARHFQGGPNARNLAVDVNVTVDDLDEHDYAASLFCSELLGLPSLFLYDLEAARS